MRKLVVGAAIAAVGFVVPAAAQDKPLVGIVSISATEANNARYISGAAIPVDGGAVRMAL